MNSKSSLHFKYDMLCFPRVGRCRLRTMWYTLLVAYLFFASGIHFLVNVRNDALSVISYDELLTYTVSISIFLLSIFQAPDELDV